MRYFWYAILFYLFVSLSKGNWKMFWTIEILTITSQPCVIKSVSLDGIIFKSLHYIFVLST